MNCTQQFCQDVCDNANKRKRYVQMAIRKKKNLKNEFTK